MDDYSNWRESAFEVYRLTWTGLEEWRKLSREDLEYWIEELREALLDLKQATITEDEAWALQQLDEIKTLVIELLRRTEGNHG